MSITVNVLRIASTLAASLVIVNMLETSSEFDLIALAFLAWNFTPCILAFAVLARSKVGAMGVGFAIGLIATTLFYHFSWMYDIGETATGSSTSGLIFIFIPIYAIGIGIVLALIGFVTSKFNYTGM